jgi:hypothetical protein
MIRFRNFALSFAGTIVAAALLAVCVPRAAHAVVATLVQVSNTASAPAITQSVSEQAQQLLQVGCSVYLSQSVYGPVTSCNFIAPTGLANGSSSIVTISPNQNFVITSVDVEASGTNVGVCPAATVGSILINSPVVGQTHRASWSVAANAGTQHFAYPSGILITGGTEFVGIDPFGTINSYCSVTVNMFGYLTTL